MTITSCGDTGGEPGVSDAYRDRCTDHGDCDDEFCKDRGELPNLCVECFTDFHCRSDIPSCPYEVDGFESKQFQVCQVNECVCPG